jgi:hypothetical protein
MIFTIAPVHGELGDAVSDPKLRILKERRLTPAVLVETCGLGSKCREYREWQ